MKNFTYLKRIICLLLLVISYHSVEAQTTSQTFNSSSTFTVPVGVTSITVEAWGAGGRGGSRIGASSTTGFGGGGAGAYSRSTVTVIPGNTYTVTVGIGSTSNTAGAAGGDSEFTDLPFTTTFVRAIGGFSALEDSTAPGAGGNAGLCIGTTTFSGGTGADGTTGGGGYGGGGGAAAGTANNGATATNSAGALGINGGGNGGNGRTGASSGAGIAGNTPGGGGGGALKNGSGSPKGGIGGGGQVIVTYGIPEIIILGNLIGIPDGDTTPTLADFTDFGSTATNVTRTFTIQNTSTTASLVITGPITFTGANGGDFVVTTPPLSPIPATGSTTFVVTFTPSGSGLRTATLNIPTNDTDENPFDYAVQGTGSGPEINITGNMVSIVDGDTTPSTADFTDFGNTGVGVGVNRPFTIQNLGTSNLTIGAVSFSGTNAGDFTIFGASPTGSIIAAGGSVTFTVRFTAGASGLRTATITIVNDDTNENPYNYDLQGTGTQQEIDVFGNLISIADGDLFPSLADHTDFGSTDVVSGTVVRVFTIRNTGTLPLNIGAFSFLGFSAADFTLTVAPNPIILPGNSSNFQVTFNPSAVGLRAAFLTFVNNDSNENPFNFSIVGLGTEQEIDIQGNLVSIVNNDITPSLADWTDFGSSNIGIGVTRTFTILNTGSSNLTIGAFTITGGIGQFVLTTPPTSPVVPGGSTTFVITFTPTVLGVSTANIQFINNDSNENPYNFRIQGNGTPSPSEMDIQGSLLSIVDGDTTPSLLDWTDFSGSSVGVGVFRTFRIFNTGTGVLTLGAITFSGTNAADFAVTTPPSATVAVAGFTDMVIRFIPGALGLRTATFSLVNNDADENPYNFNLQGTGFAALTTGPGGVRDNLQLWFRSDLLNGTTGVADGSAVNTWNTQARGVDAIRPGSVGAPIYRNNATQNINFNSVVDFTNNPATSPQNYTDLDPARQYLEGPSGFYSQDIFAVIIPDINVTSATASLDIFCGDRIPATSQTDGTGIGYGRYTNRFTNEVITYCLGTTTGAPPSGYGVAQIDASGTVNYNAAGIINASNNATINGMNLTFNANNVVNATNDLPDFANVNNSQFWMGRSEGWDGSWDGRIGEIITLSNRATNIERSNIQSYLAIKYGITLGVNGTSMNYTNSDGNVIWDATANSGFNFDIAGIGRDDISRLTQKQSRSINPTEVMTIGLTDILATNSANTSTFATNKSYLVWGANGGTMANSGVPINVDLGPTTITTITEVVNRKWKVVETGGDVATTRISVPTAAFISGLPALGPTDAYVMVVATNATFTLGVETVFMSTLAGNQTCLYDFDNTKFITFGVAHRAVNPLHITLDGMDDFVRIGDANEIGNSFSIMTWIRPNGPNSLGTERTILAKKATALTGYRVVLQNDNRVRIEWRVAGVNQTVTTNTVFPNLVWHNIAITFNAGTLNMYVDGVLDRTVNSLSSPVASTSSFSIGGQYIDKFTINNLFKGDIDEMRMWNRSLSDTEIRFIMNQEILQTGANTRGTIIPNTVTKNDINTLLWNDLFAYYSMNSYIGTHLDDDSININRGSLVIPDKISINVQTAPMPYRSAANGLWSATATWQNGSSQDLPYSLSIVDGTTPIDWNIVGTTHDISSTGNKNLLGLFVSSNTLSANNDSKIEVSHYLKIDGQINLAGKSQLVQTLNSDLDPTSSGSLRRDQQGQKNIYNYNYWSSPVGAINNTTNNNNYTVAGVMKDGTTTTPQNITWTAGLNGSPTSPITLSSYWIFKFQNLTPVYANWQSVGQNGSLFPGQGYTLKGSGSAAVNQNFTFVGKPNNGPISGIIAANNLNLSGNPYSSALDANTFITNNLATTTGTLYFWEHYSTNATHNLAQYQGGYATRTIVGGTPPIAPPGVSGLGSSTKVPGRYIPVGQGFFLYGNGTGGAVTFNNTQRAFVKEDNVLSNTLFRNANQNSILTLDHFNNNQDDQSVEDTFQKIRLGFDDRNGYHRQILIGFMNENATSGIDPGYDAVAVDNQPSDLCFINGYNNLNIVGEGNFNENNIYPLSVKTDAVGTVIFRIDAIENFDDSLNTYIYDALTTTYHDIKEDDFSIELPQGVINDRFSLRFINPTVLGTADIENNNALQIAYTNSNSMLTIKNKLDDTTVEKIELYNILGQSVGNWNVKDQNQQNIQVPIKNYSTGTYVVKIKTTKGDTSRKIIIN